MRANIERIMAGPQSENPDLETNLDAITEMRLTDDDQRFLPEELIACESCSRSNPPNRTSCLYCGKTFDVDVVNADIAKINYKSPDVWEDGYSLVYSGNNDLVDRVVRQAAELLRMSVESLDEILSVDASIPLIYLRFLPDADLLASRLSQIRFNCAVVGDDLLQAKVPPTRVRSVKFDDQSALFEDFNTGRTTPVRFDEKVIFVTGTFLRSSTEIAAKVSKKELKTTAETHGTTDEAVVDIYPVSDVYGFRIRSAGFDFSCLGEKMQPFAGANMDRLIDELRLRFAAASFVDSFSKATPLIASAWPVDELKQSSNVTRGPLGGIRKHFVTVLDNSSQFTKFSRLQRHFL